MSTQAGQVPENQNSQNSSGTAGEPLMMGDEGQEQSHEQQGGQASGTKYKIGNREFDTPEELQQYANTLSTMVVEQGRALNNMAAQRQQGTEGVQPTGRPNVQQGGMPAQQSDTELNQQFWDNPVQVLRSEMGRMIEPFRRDMQNAQQVSAVQQVRQEFPGYADLEPMVDAAVAQAGSPRTYENLKATYFMVKGYMSETGQLPQSQNNGQQNQNQQQGQQQYQQAPPQHRPSNAPLPTGTQGNVRKRQLTEDERRIARIGGYSDEQYLALIELDEEDVVTSQIGVPKNGK